MEWSAFVRGISAANVLATLIIAGFIYFSNRRSLFNILIALGLLTNALWSGAHIAIVLFSSLFASRLIFSAAIFILPFFILFVLMFSGYELTKKRIIALVLPAAVISFLSLIPGLLFDEMKIEDNHLVTGQLGWLMRVYALHYFAHLGLMAYLAYRARKILKGIKRVQLTYLIVGLFLTFSTATIFDMTLPLLRIYDYNALGPLTILPLSVSMIYVATKHHIWEPRVVLSEIWAFLLVLIVFSSLWVNHDFFNIMLFIMALGVGFLLTMAVLSESKKNRQMVTQNRQLAKAKRDLETLDKMKDEFIKMATHELNTPISIIKNLTSVVLSGKSSTLNVAQRRELEPLAEAAERLARLAKSIFEVSFLEHGGIWIKKNKTDLSELIYRAAESQEKFAQKKGVDLTIEESVKSLPKINVDRDKIYEVMAHLIENAIKFTFNGTVAVSAKSDSKEVIVTVKDTGIGISKEEQKKLFSKFYQSGRFRTESPIEQQGVGLGLFISKNIIELHGGKIEVESKEGKGSAFTLVLPIFSDNPQ